MQWHISDSIKNLLRKRADFRKMFMATQSLSDFRFWKGSSTRFWFRCCFSKSSCIFQMLWGPVADLRFHQNLMRTMGRFWVAPKRLIRFQILNGAYSKFCGGRCHSRICCIFQILRVGNPYFRKCCKIYNLLFGLTTLDRFQILTILGVSNSRRIFDYCTIGNRASSRRGG